MKKFTFFLSALLISMMSYAGVVEEPSYDLEMPLEITNLRTEVLEVDGMTYLQLNGRDDMNDATMMLFLNDYTGEEKAYDVNVESSYMTFGGLELTIVSGSIAQSFDAEKGDVFAGRVVATVEEEEMGLMTVALDLTMYAAAVESVVIEVSGAEAVVDETGTLVMASTYTDEYGVVYPLTVRLAGFENVEGAKEYEGAQIAELQIGADGDEGPWLDWAVADLAFVEVLGADITLDAQFVSYSTGATYDVLITTSSEDEPIGEVYYDVITNMSFDLENMTITGGPSNEFGVEVVLVLAEDNMDGSFTLSPESYVTILNGQEVTFLDGMAYEIDPYAPAAKVDLVVEYEGTVYQFHLDMSATPMEATVVVVENAEVAIDTIPLFDDVVDYALNLTGEWVNEADGVTYPVLVEVPVFYPEAEEPYEILSTVTVGGWGENDPWLGFGEGTLTITIADGVVTATGIVENPMAGVAIDITISGKLSQDTGIGNVAVKVNAVKMIKNGQLIINRDGKEYNVQGAIVK